MLRRPPGHTLTDTLFPSTTPFRSRQSARFALYEAEFEKLKAAGRAIPAWQPEAPVPLVEFGHTPAVLIFMPAIDIITHRQQRSEEHTSELQSLMRNSYAVLSLTKKIQTQTNITH